jgi:hypothetical protein
MIRTEKEGSCFSKIIPGIKKVKTELISSEGAVKDAFSCGTKDLWYYRQPTRIYYLKIKTMDAVSQINIHKNRRLGNGYFM